MALFAWISDGEARGGSQQITPNRITAWKTNIYFLFVSLGLICIKTAAFPETVREKKPNQPTLIYAVNIRKALWDWGYIKADSTPHPPLSTKNTKLRWTVRVLRLLCTSNLHFIAPMYFYNCVIDPIVTLGFFPEFQLLFHKAICHLF